MHSDFDGEAVDLYPPTRPRAGFSFAVPGRGPAACLGAYTHDLQAAPSWATQAMWL